MNWSKFTKDIDIMNINMPTESLDHYLASARWVCIDRCSLVGDSDTDQTRVIILVYVFRPEHPECHMLHCQRQLYCSRDGIKHFTGACMLKPAELLYQYEQVGSCLMSLYRTLSLGIQHAPCVFVSGPIIGYSTCALCLCIWPYHWVFNSGGHS